MLNDTFANRLQKALNMNNMKPTTLAEKTGIDKSLISNYLSGNYKAKQDKLSLLSEILNVSETWLMGYDVPMEREVNIEKMQSVINFGLTLFELLKYYKISEQELAKKLGIDLNILNNSLNNTELPDEESINKICIFFNIKNKEDFFNGQLFSELLKKYQKVNEVPDDKYRFGFELENILIKISDELNIPLSTIKKNFLNKEIDEDIYITYENLVDFFKRYFSEEIQKTEFKKDGVEVTIAHDSNLDDKTLLEVNNFLLKEKILKDELKKEDKK